MARIRYTPIRILRYFPPNDELAVKVARLCILVEDFILESRGVSGESLPILDELSPEWRKIYFLRNSIGTIHEIRVAIDDIRLNPTFKDYFDKQSTEEKNQFDKKFKALKAEEKTLKKIRNDMGGAHVLTEAVKIGLGNLDPSEEGFVQAGGTLKNSHLKFVHKIVSGYLASQILEDGSHASVEEMKHFFERIIKTSSAAAALVMIILGIFFKERNLFP
ncbi:MAG: hypothetical protein OEY57_05820 [Nitrospirota bacterium]|nr:hypothetical protein [Nitrospirota bacterium]